MSLEAQKIWPLAGDTLKYQDVLQMLWIKIKKLSFSVLSCSCNHFQVTQLVIFPKALLSTVQYSSFILHLCLDFHYPNPTATLGSVG